MFPTPCHARLLGLIVYFKRGLIVYFKRLGDRKKYAVFITEKMIHEIGNKSIKMMKT